MFPRLESKEITRRSITLHRNLRIRRVASTLGSRGRYLQSRGLATFTLRMSSLTAWPCGLPARARRTTRSKTAYSSLPQSSSVWLQWSSFPASLAPGFLGCILFRHLHINCLFVEQGKRGVLVVPCWRRLFCFY